MMMMMNNREVPGDSTSGGHPEKGVACPSFASTLKSGVNQSAEARQGASQDNTSSSDNAWDSSAFSVPTKARGINGVDWRLLLSDSDSEDEFETSNELASLFAVIRSRGAKSGENRVVYPVNMPKEFESLWVNLQAAAKITGCTLVADSSLTMNLSYKSVWDKNPAVQAEALDQLEGPMRARELESIACLAALVDLLAKVPTEEDLRVDGPGKAAVAFILHLLAGVYCESAMQVPLSQSKGWWRLPRSYKDELILIVSPVVGGERPARTIVTAVEILYRKFIRQILALPARNPRAEGFIKDLKVFLGAVTASGPTLFLRKLRIQTTVVTKNVANPKDRRGRPVPTKVQQKTVVRPKLPAGPTTTWEAATVSKINSCLGKIESTLGKAMDACSFSDHKTWDEAVESWVEKLYDRTSVFSKMMSSRKALVRSQVLQARASQVAAPNTGGQRSIPTPTITQGEWLLCAEQLRRSSEQDWEDESLKCFQHLFCDSRLSKERVSDMTEAAILQQLGLDLFTSFKGCKQ